MCPNRLRPPLEFSHQRQPQITRHLLAAAKAFRIAQDEHECQRRQSSHPRMGSEPFCFRILLCFPFDRLRQFEDGWIQLIQQLQQIVSTTAFPTAPGEMIPAVAAPVLSPLCIRRSSVRHEHRLADADDRLGRHRARLGPIATTGGRSACGISASAPYSPSRVSAHAAASAAWPSPTASAIAGARACAAIAAAACIAPTRTACLRAADFVESQASTRGGCA